MKKRMMLIALSAVVVMSGCGSNSAKKIETSDGGTVMEKDYGNIYQDISIPYSSLNYNGKYLELSEVQVGYGKSSHGYYPIMYAKFDTSKSNITDDELYWLANQEDSNNNDMQVWGFFTSQDNDLDSESMDIINIKYDEKNKIVQYAFAITQECKYEISSASQYELFVNIKQKETYSNESGDMHKCNTYFFLVNGDSKISQDVLQVKDMDSFVSNSVGVAKGNGVLTDLNIST